MPSVMATAVVGAGLGSSLIGANAASSAAKTQANAANQASQTQMAMYNQTRSDLTPFMSVGTSALGQLASLFGLGGGGSALGGAPQSTTGGAAYLPGSNTPAGANGFSSQDLAAIRAAYPGISSAFQTASGSADKNSPAYASHGLDSLDDYTKYWYDNMRNPADYTYQPAGSAQPATSPLAPGTSTLPPGANGSALSAQLMATPGYQFGMDQGVQALDRSAASRGLSLSGGQLKDVQSFGNNYALQQAWQPYVSELNGLATSGQNAAAGVGTAGASAGAGVASSQLAAGQASASGTVGAANSYQTALQSALQGYQMYQNGGGGWGTAANAATAGGTNYDFGTSGLATSW